MSICLVCQSVFSFFSVFPLSLASAALCTDRCELLLVQDLYCLASMHRILVRQFQQQISESLSNGKPIKKNMDVDRSDSGIVKYEQLLTALLNCADRKNPHTFRRCFFKLDEANEYALSGADLLMERAQWGRTQASDLHAMWKYSYRRIKSSKPTKCQALARLRNVRNSAGAEDVEPESDVEISDGGHISDDELQMQPVPEIVDGGQISDDEPLLKPLPSAAAAATVAVATAAVAPLSVQTISKPIAGVATASAAPVQTISKPIAGVQTISEPIAGGVSKVIHASSSQSVSNHMPVLPAELSGGIMLASEPADHVAHKKDVKKKPAGIEPAIQESAVLKKPAGVEPAVQNPPSIRLRRKQGGHWDTVRFVRRVTVNKPTHTIKQTNKQTNKQHTNHFRVLHFPIIRPLKTIWLS